MKFRFSYMLLMAAALVISQNGELYLLTHFFCFPKLLKWNWNTEGKISVTTTTSCGPYYTLKLNLVTRAFCSENNYCPRRFRLKAICIHKDRRENGNVFFLFLFWRKPVSFIPY